MLKKLQPLDRENVLKGFDSMRIALSEVDHSEDMAMQYLTMEIFKNIMEKTSELNQFADQATDQIR